MKRVRTSADVKRIGMAVSYPGIDPRTWSTPGRIEPDSLLWDPELGWVVDVQAYGTAVEGETDITARVTSLLGADGAGSFYPPVVDAEVIVSLPAGDTEVAPVVVGYLRNEATAKVPVQIHGLPISGDVEASTPTTVSPFDTEIHVSPYGRREAFQGLRFTEAASHTLQGTDATNAVLLGSEGASQSVILGNDYNAALTGFTDNVLTFLSAVATAVDTLTGSPPPGPLTQQATQLTLEWNTQVKPALEAALSQRVKAE